MPAISISNLCKYYPNNIKALDGINFDIEQGSFFGLLGHNGAGKSTLINIMAGLTKATKGSISIMGCDVKRQWRQSRQFLGIVPQELIHDPFFNIRELLRLQSGYFGFGKENYAWIDELLEVLELTAKATSNMQRLSGGMKRRVLIAQALVHKPKVVVLDEPTAGVDVELRQILWKFIKKLHKQGHTILLTTHYLEEAEKLCDKIAILSAGKVVALDEKKSLLKHLQYRFLCLELSFNLDINILPDNLRSKVKSYKNNILTFSLHREKDKISNILEALASINIEYNDLYTSEPGLEEVFISITGGKR
jgi:ABC-2 type transport system ATP-binding protein